MTFASRFDGKGPLKSWAHTYGFRERVKRGIRKKRIAAAIERSVTSTSRFFPPQRFREVELMLDPKNERTQTLVEDTLGNELARGLSPGPSGPDRFRLSIGQPNPGVSFYSYTDDKPFGHTVWLGISCIPAFLVRALPHKVFESLATRTPGSTVFNPLTGAPAKIPADSWAVKAVVAIASPFVIAYDRVLEAIANLRSQGPSQ